MNTPNTLSAGGTYNPLPRQLWNVECMNGARNVFSTRRDADEWAEWGHFCGATHVIQAVTASKPDYITPAGRVFHHERADNGSWNLTAADNGPMSEAEWEGYCEANRQALGVK